MRLRLVRVVDEAQAEPGAQLVVVVGRRVAPQQLVLVQAVGDVHAEPGHAALEQPARDGSGLRTIDQRVPFQCSITVSHRADGRNPVLTSPTAQASTYWLENVPASSA
jgi:hypothetical protein